MQENQELLTTYEPLKIDSKWYEVWEKGGYFKPKRISKTQNTYCIVMPPPNVTGQLHMGHALDITTQDTLIRYKRMQGFETLFLPGMDHAGIATQAVVEKLIWEEEKKTRQDYGREKFVAKIWEWKEKYGGIILKQQRSMGASADWSRSLFTMDPESNEAVIKVFVQLYNEGLIYQSDYIVNWDPGLQSAISDAEVEHKEIKGAFYFIKYKIAGSNEQVEIATTRPETMLGDTAICVHPEDDRFKHLIGKKAIIPICNREIPIIADLHVDRELGTGCLKVTPGHDFNDFEIGKRHKLPIINILNKDGTLNEYGMEYKGKTCLKARPAFVEQLKEIGALVRVDEKIQQIGHGDRSKAVIEPMVSKQWFLNVQSMAQDAYKAVSDDKTRFWPKGWENTYFSWLKEPKDWCLSRQLWWGHQIPVFYCQKCNHQWASETIPKECNKCSHTSIVQDQDVLDTWFSSGLWPFSTLGWPDKNRMEKYGLDRFYPTSCLVTGHDIIFFWVARMMMFSLKILNKIPFDDVYIHAIVRDKMGRKMSKSLGNGIDPLEMIALYGADALRFTLASGSGHNRDLNLDPDRIAINRNLMNKIWNAYRFSAPFITNVSANLPEIKNLDLHERWIVSELNTMIHLVSKSLDQYRFDEACTHIYSFIYDKFCSWFIELSKPVLYKGDEVSKQKRGQVLRWSFRQIVMVLHPLAPFITEELWQSLKDTNEDLLIQTKYPIYSKLHDFSAEQIKMNLFTNCISLIRNLRASVEIKPKDLIEVHIKALKIDSCNHLKELESEICNMAGLNKIKWLESSALSPSKGVFATDGQIEICIGLSNIPNLDQQVERMKKNITKIEKEFEKLNNKLSNPKFVENAPEEVIQEVTYEKNLLHDQLNSLKSNLSKFQ